MDKEQQRIAIAEACGYRKIKRLPLNDSIYGDASGELIGVNDDLSKGCEIPDYLNDLNAMHEAEKVLTDEGYEYRFGNATYSSSQVSDYNQLLLYGNPPCLQSDGCGKHGDMPPPPNSLPHLRGGLQATASQRAEAFLRTLNLWTPTGEENE